MNKRIAYPIFIISVFILFNVTLRLVDYGLTREGVSHFTLLHIYNVADIFMVLFVPAILLFEKLDNPSVKKYFYGYLAYIVYSVFINILFLTGVLMSEGVLWSVPTYLILIGIIYIGYLEDRDNNQIFRLGRSMMASGIVNLVYVFIIPTNIERLAFTYDQLSINPLTFIILIMQVLILDDIILERRKKQDESRVTL